LPRLQEIANNKLTIEGVIKRIKEFECIVWNTDRSSSYDKLKESVKNAMKEEW
jgi:hypothetical protein